MLHSDQELTHTPEPGAAAQWTQHAAPPTSPCTGCAVHPDRRSFLMSAASVLAALAFQGLVPRAASARDVGGVRAVVTDGAAQERVYPIPPTDSVQIDKSEGVIIVRHTGVLYALSLSCPHQNTALRWNDGNSTFQCPRHKSRYQPDGSFISGRATRAMDRFAVHRAGDTLVVNLDALYEQDANAAEWAAAKVAV